MIRLFAGFVAVASALGVFAQQTSSTSLEEPSRSAPKAQTLPGRSGRTIASAVVDFSELAAEEAKAKKAGTFKKERREHVHPKGSPFANQAAAASTDTQSASAPVAAQSLAQAALVASPAPATNFLGALDNHTAFPPDTMGSVGPRHLMVTINTEIKVQTRGGQTLSSVSLDGFWARLGIQRTSDPHSFFDANSGRWFIVTIADFESAAACVLMGASQTDDPTGRWNLYKIDADASNVVWPDYPTMGMNSKWVVIGANNFSVAADVFTGAAVWVFDKQSLITGAATLPFKYFDVPSGFTLQPCITYDPTEPTLYLIENAGSDTLRISTVTGPDNNPSLNVGVNTVQSRLGSWNLQGADVGFQTGTSFQITCNDPRLLNAVFRNGTIWTAHSVFFPATGFPTRAAAQWWQINPNGTVIQQAQIDDPSGKTSYGFPTINANKNNDALLGYTRFTTTNYASAAYSFRAGTDPLNTMQDSYTYKAGEGQYLLPRWGDYSMAIVDPLNDLDLWTIQEYAGTPDQISTTFGVWWAMVLRSTPPDGILDLQVNPPTLSDVAIGVPTDFFVTVSDSTEVITNATVTAQIPGRPSNVVFRNDGVLPDVTAGDNIYSATIIFASASESPVTFNATAPGKQPGSVVATYNIVPRPPNDNFTNAAKIPSGGIFDLNSAQVDNTFATTEQNEPLHAGVSNFRSLWWNYSTDTAAPILVDTSGSGPKVVVAVYTGNALTNLIPVVSTNSPPGEPAIVKFDAQPGVTYRIAVAGANIGEKGLVRLRVQPNGEPDITPPIIVVQYPPSGLVTTVPVVPFSGTAIDPAPQASGVRSVLIEDLQTEPANVVKATLSGTTWTASISLSQETNVFRVHGVDFADNASAPQEIVLYYRPTVGATNDLFAYARKLVGASGLEVLSNTNATKEFGEPLHAGNEGGKSLWWYFAPSTNGVLLLSTEGSTFDTLLALYTVADPTVNRSVSDVQLVAANDDASGGTNGSSELSAAVEAGKIYFIAVDGYGGASGTIHLQYDFQSLGVFTVTTSVDANGGGTISPGSKAFPANSAVTVFANPDRYKQFQSFSVTANGVTTTITNSPYTFELTAPTDIVAHFGPKIFTDDFERADLDRNWQNPSNNWRLETVVTNAATGATSRVARSVEMGDRQTASLILVTNLLVGTGSFEFHVSSETNADKAQFFLDGRLLATWSGEVPWGLFVFDIPPKTGNTYTLEWRYTKDFATAEGSDAFFIDNLDLPIAPPPPITVSISANPPTLTVAGPPLADLQLQASTDLINWAPVDEKTTTSSGTATFTLPAFTGTQRFYRVLRL